MRVLLVTDTFNYGGAERHTADLALALKGRGFAVRVACVKLHMALFKEPAYAPLLESVLNLGGQRFIDLQAIRSLRSLIAEFEPDVILSSNLFALMYASIARAGRPLVGVFHTTVQRSRKEELKLRFLYRMFVNRTSAFVFLCHFQADYWRSRGLKPSFSQVIYNGIDLGRFHPGVVVEHRLAARVSMGVGPDDLVVGCNAMLRPEKNHRQLLHALAALRHQGRPFVAALLGDGPERDGLEALAVELGIAKHVRFLGRQSRVEIFLAAFDIGVLPSISTETFSLAALEQMALGIPMVMSDQGGAREMLKDGEHGFVVPTGDLQALISALDRMRDGPLRAKLGAAAADNVVQRFDSTIMVDQYVELLRRIVGVDMCSEAPVL